MSNIVRIGGRNIDLPLDRENYWADRMNHDVYRLTVALARGMFYDAKSAIDVGCYTSGLICELDWIDQRVASDIQTKLENEWRHVDGVQFEGGDAFNLDFHKSFDLVISNQTIEHVEQPADFAEKLLSLGRGLIVSTTFEVAAGTIEGHIQDPISFEKFESWFPCPLDAWMVCYHPTARHLKHIVGVIKQSHPARKT